MIRAPLLYAKWNELLDSIKDGSEVAPVVGGHAESLCFRHEQ